MTEPKTMRDCLIDGLFRRMQKNKDIFFLSADFGSPKLDQIREKIPERFINVGIAEQNLINVATGLALEGFTVFAYAIAPFLTMRPYEQIRINLSLHAQLKAINVNLIGVGAGLSYDVSGPTHHCLEDITVMRALPHMEVFSPSDWVLAEKFLDYSLAVAKPKYLRLDGKPVPRIYPDTADIDIGKGFFELRKGQEICFVSTGIMTHKALEAAEALQREKISAGVVDLFLINSGNAGLLYETLKPYRAIVTAEEAFINKGGIDSLILSLLNQQGSSAKVRRMGFADRYIFDMGSREHLHRLHHVDVPSMVKNARELLSL